MSVILEAKNLSKSFRYQKRTKEAKWFSTEYTTIDAVKDLNLSINKGERVAFIGPNGAGKSTTIKMLSGILTPSGGDLTVCGLNPTKDRRTLSYRIGCVFGQRSQLLPNLPLYDSLELFGHMYDLEPAAIKARAEQLIDIFSLGEFIHQPVRQLSLGQRMRGEIAASLIHKPEIIFLDEPTIGLDIVAKRDLRRTLIQLNEQEQTTVFLTSHDTGDIESLSQRLIVIDHGKIIIDAGTKDVQKTYLSKKHFKVEYTTEIGSIDLPVLNLKIAGKTVEGTIDTAVQNINDVLHQLLNVATVEDIHLYDEELEDIIIDIYKGSGENAA